MKRILILFFLFAGFLIPILIKGKVVTNIPPDISAMQRIVITIEDFENPNNGWFAITREIDLKMIKRGEYEEVEGARVPGQVWLKTVKGAPADMPRTRNGKYEYVLGMRVKFPYPGKNFIYLIAPGKYVDPANPLKLKLGTPEPDKIIKYPPDYKGQTKYKFKYQGKYIYGIPLVGIAKGLSIWVHSRGHDYRMEGWLMDWKGGLHKFDFGSLNYVGWRPHKIRIPAYVPQLIDSWPQNKYLRFIRFVIRSSPSALANEEVFFYFDEFRLLTSIYKAHFDGEDLETFTQGGAVKSIGGGKNK